MYQDLIKQLRATESRSKRMLLDRAAAAIERLSAEAEPVRHSRWKLLASGNGICEACRCTTSAVWDFDNSLRYCPNCGAKMDATDTIDGHSD